MMMRKPGKVVFIAGKLICFLWMIAWPAFLTAQSSRVTLHVDHMPFTAFADTLEKLNHVNLYYADPWVDTVYVSVNADHQTVEQVLHEVLAPLHLRYLTLDKNRIVLLKDITVKTGFKEAYLKYLHDQTVAADTVSYRLQASESEMQQAEANKYRLFKIGNPALMNRGTHALLSGYVTDGKTRMPAIGVVVYIPKIRIGTTTDKNGHYTLLMPKGQHVIEYRAIGMRTERRNIMVYSDGSFDMEIFEQVNQLDEVTVSANRENNVQNLRMGIEKISMRMLKQIPMGLGEVDVVKSSLLLPGVQSVGEAASGYNIRGGSTDQNLMLLNFAPIMNSSHFFGFFSAFNSDMIESVTLYKSGVPAKFGGRTSSVMDIRLKEGDTEKIKASGGISPVTGRVMIEGPVTKKATFVLGARTTYSDWLLHRLSDLQLQQSSAGFIDLQGNTVIKADKDNTITLSGYYSSDRFDYYKESSFKYRNIASTLQWNHVFKPGLFADFMAIVSDYSYQVNSIQDTLTTNSLTYRLHQDIARADFTWLPVDKHKVTFGLNTTYYRLLPGEQVPLQDDSTVPSENLETERSVENAFYVSDEVVLSPRVTLYGGLRATLYAAFGPGTVYEYAPNQPLSVESMTDTLHYGSGSILAFYPGLGYRLTARVLLNYGFSFKAGIQRMPQYIQMISNTTAISPTDMWKLSDRYIKPQKGTQFSMGLYRNFDREMYELSIETYYKFLGNVIDYKNGATLLMNDHLETELLHGRGKAYGLELMLKKTRGDLSGWISYTWSRVFHQVDGEFDVEKVNGGAWFPANYDKPEDLKVVVNAKLSRRFNVTSNVVYSTGRPITYPAGYYQVGGVTRIFYSNRNEFRIPDYFRVDLAATLNGNLKKNKLNHSTFTLAVYNVFGRRNPYSIFFRLEDGEMQGYKLSIFGQPIVTLTYNFRIFGNALGDF